MLAQAEADPALDGILKDAGRNVGAKCLAYLHVTGGLTLPRLKAFCASIRLAPQGPFALAISPAARRFGVCRTHIRRTLVAA
ncbi:MAG: hypothetical protein ACRECE_09025, partial [Xanthobacteraceae bacterium]